MSEPEVNITLNAPLEVIVEMVDAPDVTVDVPPTPSVITVEIPGPAGPIGPEGPPGEPGAAGDLHYVHMQAVAATNWSVTHNLGKHPAVTVVDSSGNEVMGDVEYVSDDALTLHFSVPFSGVAYMN